MIDQLGMDGLGGASVRVKPDPHLTGVEAASNEVLAIEPLVVPNQYDIQPVQAVPSDPSMMSNGGELTTVSS